MHTQVKQKNMKDKSVKIGFPTTIVREGQVNFFAPRLEAFVSSSSDYAPSKAPVFFNPIMELNRDIAVLALQSQRKYEWIGRTDRRQE